MRLLAFFNVTLLLITSAICTASPLSETIIPTSEQNGQLWQYTLTKPANNWHTTSYDDSSWLSGRGGFGSLGLPNSVVRSVWEEKDIWLRQHITIKKLPDTNKDLAFRIHHDEDTQIYLNGTLIADITGWTQCYSTIDIDDKYFKLLKKGDNLLAVHCRQTTGGEYIDVGLEAIDRWKANKAKQWYYKQPWPCGFNYVPANAISYTEMWMEYNYNPDIIDREMAIAEKDGFNCARVVLPFVVWEHNPEDFKARLENFISICDRHHVKVMPALFDDCAFGRIVDPEYGKQPDVVDGWYANGWTPSPGHSIVRDSSQWPRLKAYVTDICSSFANDKRILCWDVYNEPTNGGLGNITLPLLELVFNWARQQQPIQPLTAGIFDENILLNEIIIRYSDIISFHCYGSQDVLQNMITKLKQHNRPLICTEWLNRNMGSNVAQCLPVFAKEDTGCLHWGLVNGKTQTDLNWGHRPGHPLPPLWQHDIYRENLTPYSNNEIELFKMIIKEKMK